MLRLNAPRAGLVLALAFACAWCTSGNAGAAGAARGDATAHPALLVLPVATGPSVDESAATGLQNAIETKLTAAGARPIAAAAGSASSLRSDDDIRAAAATVGADGVLSATLSRVPRGVKLELSLRDGSSGAVTWRSGLEQPNVEGLRAYLPELLGEVARAAGPLAGRPAAAAKAAVAAPVVAAPASGASVTTAAAAGAGPTVTITPPMAAPPTQPTPQIQPLPPATVTVPPRIEAPVPLDATSAPMLAPPTSYALPFALRDFDSCRLDGTWPGSFVAIDDHTLHVLPAPASNAAEELAHIDARSLQTFVGVDCADLDGDGTDEIALTARRNGAFHSQIYRASEGGRKLEPLGDEIPFAIRSAAVGGGKHAFYAQNFPISGRLYGPIRPLGLKDGNIVYGRDLDVMSDANVGALALGAATGVADDAALTVDGDARLRLMRAGRVVWTGPGHYGGYDVSFEAEDHLQSTSSSLPRVYFRDRIDVAERGGAPFVIATEIEAALGNVLPNLNVGRGLTAVAFRWNGQGLVSVPPPFAYSPESLSGADVRDLRVADLTGDHIPDLILGVLDSDGGLLSFSKAASRILVFPGTPLTDAGKSAQ